MAGLHECSGCGYRFEDEESLEEHEEACAGEDESFACPGCGNLMDDQDMFDEHEPRCPDLNEED